MKNFTFFLFTLILLSCHKVEPPKDVTNGEDNIDNEYFISGFTDYVTNLTVGLSGWDGLCGAPNLFLTSSIRFQYGFNHNNNYFYSIQKKIIKSNDCVVLDSGNWQTLNVLYRYSFSDKKALIYSSVNDSFPEVIFDFNCSIGDTIMLNQERQIRLKVTNFDQQIIQGISFPLVKGTLISYSNTGIPSPLDYDLEVSSSPTNEITISPFSPNPYWTGYSLTTLFQTPWGYNDFCQNVSAVMFSNLTANCKSQTAEQEIYSFGIFLH
jgi:hypothetical protein